MTPTETVEYQECWKDDRVAGLILVSNVHGAAVLLGQPARYAASKLDHGVPVTASERVNVGNGDLQVIHTPDGPTVFVRPIKVVVENKIEHDAPYAVLQPSAAQAWLDDMAANGWRWPAVSDDGHQLKLSVQAQGEPDLVVQIQDATHYVSPIDNQVRNVEPTRPDPDAYLRYRPG